MENTQNTLLDPWNDAAKIAQLLQQPSSSLVIGLGAEWCQLCTDFKPQFLDLATSEPRITWLWYSLEEHEELLGDFYPETLPLVWVYQGSKLVRYGTPNQQANNIATGEPENSPTLDVLDFIKNIPVMETISNEKIDIRRFLIEINWAA